jgi:transcriptional regulator with XRE-family HTH domain
LFNPRDPTGRERLIDRHVGDRIRHLRKACGLRQGDIGDALGVSAQQVQKYETGANRLPIAKLWFAADLLRVSPAYFFEGLDREFDLPAEA